jgi:hypothetical protein
MSTFQVPQFIETKPKIIGPLTLQQFLYVAAAGGLSFIAFSVFSVFLAFVLTIIFGAIGLALAFVKINGQLLPKIFISALNYWFQPRLYTWQRIIQEKTIETPEENILKIRRNISLQEKLKDFAQKITTGKLLTFEKRAKSQTKEHYQIVKRITGEQEMAKRIDYL